MMKKLLLAMALMPMMVLAVKAGSIADGLDLTDLSWTTGGMPSVAGENVDWFYSTDDSCSDGDCVMSGAGGAGYAPSWLKTTIQGPCKISFQYKFQTYGGSFVLTDNSNFLINKSGVYTGRSEPWTFAEFEIGGGSHELKFQYTHPGQGFVGAFNGVHLDEFRVEYDLPQATTWYVDGTSGSDSYSGTNPTQAKKTIQAAIDVASSGDVVRVSSGVYAPIGTSNKSLTIVAINGPDETYIEGAGKERCVNTHIGFGLESKCLSTKVVGFTIQDGHTEGYGDDANGCGALGGTYVRCVFSNNRSDSYMAGGGACDARLENCLLVGNSTGGNGGACSGSELINCTVVDNYASDNGGGAYMCKAYNCIFFGNTSGWDWGNDDGQLYWTQTENVYLNDPCFADSAHGNYQLTANSPCIDAGDNAYVTSATDLDGNARIVNGKVDIGCYEYGTESSPNNGLVAWYKFDGDVSDSSGNGNDLFFAYGGFNGEEGVSGLAIRLTADTTLGVHGVCAVSNTFSYSCWYKTDREVRLANPQHGGTDYDSDNFVLLPCQPGTTLPGHVGVGIKVGTNGINVYEHAGLYRVPVFKYENGIGQGWHNVTLTVANNGMPIVYLDGVEVRGEMCDNGKKKGISLGKDANQLFAIGACRNGINLDGFFDGTIDDLRIYNRALSAAEVRALYDGGGAPVVTKCAVTFDATGGTAGWTKGEVAKGAAVGTLPTATWEGYEFLGWFTAAVGGTQVTATTVVTEDVTFYAQWAANVYVVKFDANGGTGTMSDMDFRYDEAQPLPMNAFVRTGYTFAGWAVGAPGGRALPDCANVKNLTDVDGGVVTLYARWTPKNYVVDFNPGQGGTGTMPDQPMTYDEESALYANLFTRTGYTFAGWAVGAPGGRALPDCANVKNLTDVDGGVVTLYAQWTPIRYAITYVNTMGAANPNPTSYTIEDAVTFAALPDVEGWRFVGWSFAGISRGNTGDVTVSANWESATPSVVPDVDDEEPMDAGVANTYDGIIMDADGLPVGYISIKAAKATGRGEVKTSKVTATIQMAGEAKKVTVKGNVNVSEATLVQAAPDGRVLDLMFTRNSIFGTFDGYEIEGVRNLLASTAKGDKGSEAKQRAEVIYNRLKGNYVMAYGDEAGWNGLSLSIMTKGKVKVSGALADGTKVTTSTQMIVGEDYCCIPVIYTKKNVSLAFSVYFSNSGDESFVFGYYDAVISRVAALDGECAFCLDGDLYGLFDEAGYELVEDFLPWEVSVAPKGTKWIVADGAKAGQIKMDKDGEVYDAKESDNPSGLKLTFTAKTGLFKGSFKVYAIDAKGKLKSFSATVNGIVVDGLGYGTATIKKIGSVSVVIE